MKSREFVKSGSILTLDNGTSIHFWDDEWVGGQTLKTSFPDIYHLSRRKDAMISEMIRQRVHGTYISLDI